MDKDTTTDLMQRRRKLIAPYPHCQYEVGTVLYVAEDGELFSPEYGYCGSQWKITIEDADKCDKNFNKLEWHEERKPSDMPEYAKDLKTGFIGKVFGIYLRGMCIGHEDNHVYYWNCVPVSEQEYLEYQKLNHG